MKFKHKNSGEELSSDDFPYWYKMGGVYGYLMPLDNKILFFQSDSIVGVCYQDITDQFENTGVLETARQMYSEGKQLDTIRYIKDTMHIPLKEAYDYFNTYIRGI